MGLHINLPEHTPCILSVIWTLRIKPCVRNTALALIFEIKAARTWFGSWVFYKGKINISQAPHNVPGPLLDIVMPTCYGYFFITALSDTHNYPFMTERKSKLRKINGKAGVWTQIWLMLKLPYFLWHQTVYFLPKGSVSFTVCRVLPFNSVSEPELH